MDEVGPPHLKLGVRLIRLEMVRFLTASSLIYRKEGSVGSGFVQHVELLLALGLLGVQLLGHPTH